MMSQPSAAMIRSAEVPQMLGLALSGGGFRAAAYHLGALMYLQRAGLLSRVRLLSTVSGGTFTGAKWALALVQGQSAGDFFCHDYAQLRDGHAFRDSVALLGSARKLNTASGRKNLITCAAEIYSTQLFARPDGTPFRLGDLRGAATGRLQEITFNATDFRRGLAFRFQKTAEGLIGNREARIAFDEAADVRIGDIVAASSCFPGGFEPMEFPRDFAWCHGIPAGIRRRIPDTPLMDGGVYDNQGLESLLLADQRISPHGPAADTLMISDADRPSPRLYDLPTPVRAARLPVPVTALLKLNPPLRVIGWLINAVFVLCVLSLLAIGANLRHAVLQGESLWQWQVLFASVLPLLLAAGTASLALGLRFYVQRGILPLIPVLRDRGWAYLKHVGLADFLDMCNARLTSSAR